MRGKLYIYKRFIAQNTKEKFIKRLPLQTKDQETPVLTFCIIFYCNFVYNKTKLKLMKLASSYINEKNLFVFSLLDFCLLREFTIYEMDITAH